MKNISLLFIALFISLGTFAQNRVFCEIVERNPGGKKVKVMIDFGQKREKSKSKQTLVNDEGEKLIFNSKIDALNYMTKLGWVFTQAYTIVEGSGGGFGATHSEIHWLLYKEIEEGQDPYEGLTTLEAYSKE